VKTGEPVQNAKIKIEWIEVKEFTRSAEILTDNEGKFVLQFYYYPWSRTRWPGADVCDAVLKEINLYIAAEGFQDYKSIYKLDGRKTSDSITLKKDAAKNRRAP